MRATATAPDTTAPRTTAGITAAEDAVLGSLHPDCPDWERLGPTARDAGIRAAAEAEKAAAKSRESRWAGGFNRRTFLKGGMGVGVAALGAQLVTSRVAYAAPGTAATTGTVVVIFLRGGMDGLSMLVPVDDPNLLNARPGVAVRGGGLIGMGRGFGLHPAMAPLKPLIDAGKVAAVPAVSTPDLSRSHFQAQDCLERGSTNSATSGWLDRVLEQAGPGTTFRSVSVGGLLPRSLMGTSGSMSMRNLEAVDLAVDDTRMDATTAALESLYTGLDHPISAQSLLALDALGTVADIRTAQEAGGGTEYPEGNFADALKSLAGLIKAKAGVRVACIDVGGWDTHTGMGDVSGGDMMRHLGDLAAALAAFTTDIGPELDSTTVLTMSEFGRRVEQNASGGTDHGHGGVLLAMGGGVKGGVHGRWDGLGADVLEQGDVPGWNDYRDVLTEIVSTRLGISVGSMGAVFPEWKATPVGLMA